MHVNQSSLCMLLFEINYTTTIDVKTGSYSNLKAEFILRRDSGYFLIHMYVPTVLIVILSWVSFWITYDPTPDRVAIVLVTVLTITTMSDSINDSLPKVCEYQHNFLS